MRKRLNLLRWIFAWLISIPMLCLLIIMFAYGITIVLFAAVLKPLGFVEEIDHPWRFYLVMSLFSAYIPTALFLGLGNTASSASGSQSDD